MTKQQPPFKLNDIIEVNITGLGSSGEGVGKADGFTVFVHGALPGEKVSVKLFQVRRKSIRKIISGKKILCFRQNFKHFGRISAAR